MDESMEEEPFPEQEGASVEGRSQDVRNEARKNAGSNQHRPGPLRPVKGPVHMEGAPADFLPPEKASFD
jgi:hypothetical protein